MNKEQTPISKYLASLERRQALLTPSPQPDPAAIIRKINFEDTFFQGDQSMLHVSPSPDPSERQACKRKRLSVLGEVFEDEENLHKKLSDLERLLQQTQGELIESRAMNSTLEHQISLIKRSNSEKLVGFETSEKEMRSRMRVVNEQTDSLKEQLNRVNKREGELQDRIHKQTESHGEKMKELENKLRILETENLELKGKFESGTLRQSDEMKRMSTSLQETEMGAEKWVMESQLLRDQLELKDRQLQKYQNELKEAQIIICKYNEIKAKFDQPKSPDGSTESLEEKIRYFENLYVRQQTENIRLVQKMDKISDDNKMLRSSMNKEMLLEEQISAFEDEVNSLRKSIEDKATVEAHRDSLQSELSTWKKTAFKLDPDCTNPMKLEAFIRKIQNQLLESKLESATMKLTISSKDRIIAKSQEEAAALQDQVKKLTIEKDNFSDELKKITRRLSLVTKDRDGLKDLKESYEKEFEAVVAEALQQRINQLETTVAEYEAIIQEEPTNKKSCAECEKRIVLITEIRTEMDKLKQEKAEVETQLAKIGTSGTGTQDDGNTTGVKIVSFGVNPSALSLEARLKEAAKENEELKEKLKELQDQTTAGPSSSAASNSGELEDRNKTLERKLEILSEAYDFETQQLQLIVNKLCGFHFTLVREPSVQLRLSSIYSHTQDETFIFQESPNGDMLLLESPILDNFRDDIDRFLLREGSIPGFLSSVTITYVQSQNTPDATSQLPASQEIASEEAPVAPRNNPREIQVEVESRRRPTIEEADEEEDDEDAEEDEDHEEDMGDDEEHEQDEDDMDGEGDGIDEEDDRYDEEVEEEEEREQDDESEEEPESPPRSRGRQATKAPPPGDESDDSDIIMID